MARLVVAALSFLASVNGDEGQKNQEAIEPDNGIWVFIPAEIIIAKTQFHQLVITEKIYEVKQRYCYGKYRVVRIKRIQI